MGSSRLRRLSAMASSCPSSVSANAASASSSASLSTSACRSSWPAAVASLSKPCTSSRSAMSKLRARSWSIGPSSLIGAGRVSIPWSSLWLSGEPPTMRSIARTPERSSPGGRRSSTPPRCARCCRRSPASVSTVPQTPAVEIGALVKRYGETTAVDGLTLSAARGAVTGILGPNGAGKTPTIEICEGYRKADQGTVRVLGRDPVRDARTLRPRVGVMLQSGGIPPSVPAADYLTLLSRFHAHPVAVPALLDLVGLTAAARTPYKRLSGGQQQRLSLAAAVIGRPELVFLDEPTAGMDPQARHATWDLTGQLRSAGASIILTTHFMEEAERLCDFVVIIDHGQLVAEGTPGQLTGTVGQLRFRAEPGLDVDSLLAALPPASLAKESPAGHYVIEVPGAVDPR